MLIYIMSRFYEDSTNGDIDTMGISNSSTLLLNTPDTEGKTALMLAAINGRLTMIEHLVKQGADVTITDTRGGNVLMYAAEGGHMKLVEYLLGLKDSFGKPILDIHQKDDNGETVLTSAAYSGNTDLVDYIWEKMGIQDGTHPAGIISSAAQGSFDKTLFNIKD